MQEINAQIQIADVKGENTKRVVEVVNQTRKQPLLIK